MAMIGALVIHMRRLPFQEMNLNMLETKSIICGAITIYCGLYYLSGSLNEDTKIFFFVVILLVNIWFFISWIIVFSQEFTAKIRNEKPEYYYKLCKRLVLVQPYLKFTQHKVKQLATRRLYNDQVVMNRKKFLSQHISGNFRNNKELTDKEFKRILENKGKMCMQLMQNNVDRQIERWEAAMKKSSRSQEELPLPSLRAYDSVPLLSNCIVDTYDEADLS